MTRVVYFFFWVFNLYVVNLYAQYQQPIWIGASLTEVYFANGKWMYQSENEVREIGKVDSSYYVLGKLTLEPRYEIGFQRLEANLDTIILHQKWGVKLFLKPELVPENKFKWHSFEFDILDAYGLVKTKYHLNKYGVFRMSNRRNETLIEKNISEIRLNDFLSMIGKIDVYGIEKAKGWRNNCDEQEYSFTFWDWNGKRLNYTAISIRKQLVPEKING